MQDNTLTLKTPIEHKGHTYSTLTMREPRVRDTVIADKQGGTDAEVEIRIFANLCEVPPAVVENMAMRDYRGLQSIYEGFLS